MEFAGRKFDWQGITSVNHVFCDIGSMNKATTFTWEPRHQEAFMILKKALVSPPLLDYPQKHDQFILTTDASDSGLGAVLSTTRGPVIKYASRT